MKMQRPSFSLRSQLLTVLLIATMTILLVMGAAMYYSASQVIRAELASSTAMAIDKSAAELDFYLEKLSATATILAENPQVCRSFGQPHDAGVDTVRDMQDVEAIIDAVVAANSDIRSIILIGADGSVISNEAGLDMHFTDKVVEEPWYQEVQKGMMPVLSSARMQEFSMDRNNWVISYGREITNLKGEPIGVLRIDLKYQAIETILSGLGLGKSGYAYILNGNGDVVYHRDTSYFENDAKKLELQQMLDMSSEQLNREGMLTHQALLTKADWRLVGVASLDALSRMQRDIVLAIWLLGIALLVLSLAASSWLATRIAKPVENLVRRQEQDLRAQELRVLNGQINPHFLYNTLDTIVWLAETGKNDRVVDVSKAMARFYRLSLRGGSEETTVREELDHVRQYLLIQKERYGDKLEFEIAADELALDATIPKILLQPLVENAIYHGIRKNENGGKIKIEARMMQTSDGQQKTTASGDILLSAKNDTPGDILLSVTDNGPGFDASVPVVRDDKSPRLSGVGLHNIDERLRLVYGEQTSLRIDTAQGKGTRVSAWLPYRIQKRT